jgi:hypothetical protein
MGLKTIYNIENKVKQESLTPHEIRITAQAKHHGYTLALLGFLSLVLILTFIIPYWQQAKLVIILLILVALVISFVGVMKVIEPQSSFILVPQYIRYQHKYGHWQLNWYDIANISEVSESVGIERIDLPYVGIRLHDINSLINNISPRLASRLLHEHRPLIIFCLQHRLLTFEESIINFTPFSINNKKITGPTAAFLHQAIMLKKALGFELYLPVSAFDRDSDSFVNLLKNCQRSAKQYK